MPRAVTEADRAYIAKLHADGLGRNEIAAKAGFSAGTITAVCKRLGLNFDRTATATATAARQIDAKARRGAIADRLYARVEAQLARLEEQWYAFPVILDRGEGGGTYTDEHEVRHPPAQDERAHAGAISTYLASAAKLEALDADRGETEAKSMLIELGKALGVTQS